MIVSGYSGRDANVMEMFHEAISQNNAFPHGLYWTVPQSSTLLPAVADLLEAAQKQGVSAYLVESGTFDILLSKIWKQIPNRPDETDKKVRTATAKGVAISFPRPGKSYPIIRTNGLPVIACPKTCAQIVLNDFVRFDDLKNAIVSKGSKVAMTKTDRVLAWGSRKDITNVLNEWRVKSITAAEFKDPVSAITEHTLMKAFYEDALTRAMQRNLPLLLDTTGGCSLAIDPQKANDPAFQPLKLAVGYEGKPGSLCGNVKGVGASWAEAIGISLEERQGSLILLLTPRISITPSAERENCFDFIRAKRIYRYNHIQNQLLEAWVKLLFGATGAHAVKVTCFEETEFPAEFTISTRSVFSRPEATDAT